MMQKTMFLVENNVPDVYVNESRDFQLVSRLYDLALQSTRFSIDSIDYISDTKKCNDRILTLLGSKVGFFSSLNLSDATHRKVLAAFPHIMRWKGSLEGIQLILNLFMHITNSKLGIKPKKPEDDSNLITIVFYDYMLNLDLLQELIEYIRPTGMLFDYEFTTHVESSIDYVLQDDVKFGPLMKYVDLREDSLTGAVIQTVNPDVSNVADRYNKNVANNVGFTVVSRGNEQIPVDPVEEENK